MFCTLSMWLLASVRTHLRGATAIFCSEHSFRKRDGSIRRLLVFKKVQKSEVSSQEIACSTLECCID
jgi:hypothetical protein